MASKTTTVSPEGARAAGCSATCDSYHPGVVPPSYQGDVTLAYTNYQVIATGVGNWRPKLIKVTHSYTYSDGSTGGETITYRSSDHGDANPWSFPATKNYSARDNPFEWTETDSGTEWRLRTIDDTITGVEVEFEESTPPTPTSYTITTAVSPAGSGTATGGGTFNSGASCTLTATPASGYSFVRWEKNGAQVSTSASYTFIVSESATYTAVFESATPLVHIQVVAFKSVGRVTLSGMPGDDTQSAWTTVSADIPVGDPVTITATPTDPNVHPFKAWYLNPSAWGNPEQTGTLVPGAGATYTFTASANATYFATFDNLGMTVEVKTYSEYGPDRKAPDATVSINGQSDGDNDFTLVVLKGSAVVLGATAYGGLEGPHGLPLPMYFVGWLKSPDYDTILSDSLQYTVQTSQSDYWNTYVAKYVTHYTLNTSVRPIASAGTVSLSPLSRYGNNLYPEYSDVTLTAAPNHGWKFKHWIKKNRWSEVVVSSATTYTVEITYDLYYDTVYIAVFEWDGTDLLVNSANLGSPIQLVHDPTTNLLVADY